MEYTPSVAARIEERSRSDIMSLSGPAIIRELRVYKVSINGDWLRLHIHNADIPLVIHKNFLMTFGTENISALEYVWRVLEQGDLIDVIAGPAHGDGIPIGLFWIHIVYVGQVDEAGFFSRKEDGLFAMRAKAGEKAERIVAKELRDNFKHSFDSRTFETPGYFEIRYDKNKRQRRPDLKCLCCNVSFEVKKRNKDKRFRISHSAGRPFSRENSQHGWHAFVFPDMKPRFLSNRAISDAIVNGDFDPGMDQYDSWADVHGEKIREMQPPHCT